MKPNPEYCESCQNGEHENCVLKASIALIYTGSLQELDCWCPCSFEYGQGDEFVYEGVDYEIE